MPPCQYMLGFKQIQIPILPIWLNFDQNYPYQYRYVFSIGIIQINGLWVLTQKQISISGWGFKQIMKQISGWWVKQIPIYLYFGRYNSQYIGVSAQHQSQHNLKSTLTVDGFDMNKTLHSINHPTTTHKLNSRFGDITRLRSKVFSLGSLWI